MAQPELARFTRRLLHHPAFRTNAQRLGAVVHVGYTGVCIWRLNAETEVAFSWLNTGRSR